MIEVAAPPSGVVRERVAMAGGEASLLKGGEGPPLLFLHASGGAGLWLPVHEQLAQHFTVLAPDHPGFGYSDDLNELEDVQDLAFHYADLLNTLGIAQAAVMGMSFGGWIAAELAAYRPSLVSRLVLINPIGLYVQGDPIADLFIKSPAQKVEALFHDPSLAAGLLPAEPDLDVILALAREEASFARFAWSPFCHDPRLPRLLPRIEARTLVLWGAHDALMSRAHGERYAELIPNAWLEEIPDCGHAAAMERPVEVAARASSFLTD